MTCRTSAQALHEDAIIIDSTCPLLTDFAQIERYRTGGATAIAPTVGGWHGATITFAEIGRWLRHIDGRNNIILVRTAEDIVAAKRANQVGIIFHFQGTEPIEDKLDLIESYKAAGVGVIQLAYNVKNRVGDGCEERTDAGLSHFGVRLVERLNRVGIVVDCSHTGHRTALDAIQISSKPVICSHANSYAVHPSPRNIKDDLAEAVAATGGVIGVAGFPAFVSADAHPSLDAYIDHIAHYAALVGIDHVALGIDYFWGQSGIASDAEAHSDYEHQVRTGNWGPSYPPPPYHYPAGIETPDKLSALTGRLLDRGFAETDIRKILGQNWLRVYREVWG